LTAIVYCYVWADAGESAEPAAKAVWDRFLERVWAVIVIDLFFGELTTYGLTWAFSSNALQIAIGIVLVVLSILLIFADVSATVDDGATVWSLIPRACLRSIVLTCQATVFARALALFAFELLLISVAAGVASLFGWAHVPDPIFWAVAIVNTVTLPFLAAIALLVYRDAIEAVTSTSD
jgi:FtsH-binding integral membrane protein